MNGLKMPQVNMVLIAGRCTSDPELRYTQSGVPVLNMRIANNTFYKTADGEWRKETAFVDVVVWQALAERCYEYLKKGSAALVQGRLTTDEWQSRDGENRSTVKIRADRVQFLEREEGEGDEHTATANVAAGAQEGENDLPF